MNSQLERPAWQWWGDLSQLPVKMGVVEPADLRAVALVVVTGLVADAAVRSGVASVTGAGLVALAGVALLASGRVTNPQAAGLVASAAVFGSWLGVRTSPWLIPFDILAAGALLAAAASLARGGSLLDLTVPSALVRGVHAGVHGLAAPVFVAGAGAARSRSARIPAILRGTALALPVLVVLGLLLASADAVFASFFKAWDPTTVVEHLVLIVAGAWGMAGLLRVASSEPVENLPRFPLRVGTTETAIVLGSMVALFAAFAVSQLVALSGSGRHVIRTAGLTYAEYARAGFFQLLVVAAITLAVLMSMRAFVDGDDSSVRRVFLVLAEAAIVLTLFIVVVAVHRLDLYEDAFGLTMLRLYSEVFAFWIAAVFVALGISFAGLGRNRQWFLSAAVASGLLALLVLNVVNPEAVVVRHNITQTAETGHFDPTYLADLSDDAVPALIDALPRLDAGDRLTVLSLVCAGEPEPAGNWVSYNAAGDNARQARNRACR